MVIFSDFETIDFEFFSHDRKRVNKTQRKSNLQNKKTRGKSEICDSTKPKSY